MEVNEYHSKENQVIYPEFVIYKARESTTVTCLWQKLKRQKSEKAL